MWSDLTLQLVAAACEEDLAAAGDITSGLLPEPTRDVVARVVPREVGVICGLALGESICDIFAERLNHMPRDVSQDVPRDALTSKRTGSTLDSSDTGGATGNQGRAAGFSPRGPSESASPPLRKTAQAEACGSSSALRFEVAHLGTRPVEDGMTVNAGDVTAMLRGPEAAVLAVERTLLNFLGRMSGVATLTRKFVDAAKTANPRVQVLDTRKTIPGWRELDKYAVRCGGGVNHRYGLYDAILIKDNHLAGVPAERLAARLFEMLNRKPEGAKFVEVEVDTLDQLREVCKVVGVDIVLLDNFSLDDMRRAVELRDAAGLREKLKLEASGGVSLERVAEIAATGVDRISVGALTHSAPNMDIGLDF